MSREATTILVFLIGLFIAFFISMLIGCFIMGVAVGRLLAASL